MTEITRQQILDSLQREVDRHCTERELTEHATKQDHDKPFQQVFVEEHVAHCHDCQIRLAMLIPRQAESAHWRHLSNVLFCTTRLEASVGPNGTALLFGGARREQPLHLGESAPTEPTSVIKLPNNLTVDVQVRAVERGPLRYEVQLSSAKSPNIFYSISQPRHGVLDARPSQIDLGRERTLRRAELGFTSKVRVEPGLWHLAFWSRVSGEPWSVVELMLYEDDAAGEQSEGAP